MLAGITGSTGDLGLEKVYRKSRRSASYGSATGGKAGSYKAFFACISGMRIALFMQTNAMFLVFVAAIAMLD